MISSRRKGFRFEHDVVNLIQSFGLEAQRAHSSDGRTMGWPSEVDLVFGQYYCQLKRRNKLPDYLKMDSGVNLVIIREDQKEALALIQLNELLHLITAKS